MLRDEGAYISSPSMKEASAVVKYLCLASRKTISHFGTEVRMRELVRSFWHNPVRFRNESTFLFQNGHDLFEHDKELVHHGQDSYDP